MNISKGLSQAKDIKRNWNPEVGWLQSLMVLMTTLMDYMEDKKNTERWGLIVKKTDRKG